jgi:uncharacterized membrane protein YoaK (UPF0700 family)
MEFTVSAYLSIIPVILGLLLAYVSYRRAKRSGEWAWSRFFILIGAIVVFFCGFMLPIMTSTLMDTHLNLMFAIMFGGMAIFVGTIRHLFLKYPVKRP